MARLPRAHRKAAVLRTPPDLLLEQEIVLPLTAEPDLKRVVAYEMDRLTPFRAEQVFWTCLAGMRDTVRRRLHVRLTLVPRGRVEPVLAALRLAGLVPCGSRPGPRRDSRRVIPLAEDGIGTLVAGASHRRLRTGRLRRAGATAIALPFILQSIALSQLDARIDALRPQAAAVEALRKQIAGGAATADVVVAARKQVGTPLQSIALLTELLPDDTYVTTLGLRQRKLTVSGRSASAARLIGAMAANPMIHGPAFVAPVIRDETNGEQMFSIRADLGP